MSELSTSKSSPSSSSTPPETSILRRLRDKFVSSGGKKPSDSDSARMLKSWKSANEKTKLAEKTLEEAKAIESKAVLDLAVAYGAKSLKIDGEVYDFACRGETVFFRRKGVDIVDLS